MEEFIKLSNLTFEYSNEESLATKALNDVSFAVSKGSFLAVIGQNGSGKSTLARNLNGLLLPTEGKILIDGLDTADDKNLWEIRRKVAMVFQNPDNQIVSSIVEDDVAFGPENLGVNPKEIRERVDDALKRVGMYQFKDKGPHQLSGGQKQRIAIASAIAMKPECIVFDEPTAMLDPSGRQEVMNIIKDLHNQGITVILITHFMEEAAQADEIVVMDKGVIKLQGTPLEVFKETDKLRELHLGVPAAVELAEELRARGISVPQDIIDEESLVRFLCQ